MAKILEFKIPEKPNPSDLIENPVVTSSVNDVMLIIHHALHGSDDDSQPRDRELAAQLLDELSSHIKNSKDPNEDDCLILSNGVSQAVLNRY
jgi:hypothetical protein